MAIDSTTGAAQPPAPYSVTEGALQALKDLISACEYTLPVEFLRHVEYITFDASSPGSDMVHFPCPLREQDAMLAIKALEACAAAAIVDLLCGDETPSENEDGRRIVIDVDKTSCFLMSAYLTTIDGLGKLDNGVKAKLQDTDINRAQSNLYRRLSANLYETKNPGEYYHIHGSLEATKTLEMIGLPPFNSALEKNYRASINTIESAVKKFTSKELDEKNMEHRQAGIPALTWDQFLNTPHGEVLSTMAPMSVEASELWTPPVPFSPSDNLSGPQYALRDIKVLELCRIIAGPTIGRSLAAHGATVLKVTSPDLPDVPFFQVDVNTGKHAIKLDLKKESGRETFERLLADADVIIDGYRPGALARLGYGKDKLLNLAACRSRGIVYVAEDCFGGTRGTGTTSEAGAEWAYRPGWQQIADCVTGVAWAQGKFMGIDEPVVPPFPMSDYGTGALGCVAAMAGLYNRATKGGSWFCRTSLCQYDVFLMSLGLLPEDEQQRLRKVHNSEFFKLRHHDSVDMVGSHAVHSMRSAVPHLFDKALMHTARSAGFNAVVAWPKEAIRVEGLRIGHVRATRPNGFDDEHTWEGWGEDAISE
ncbi:CoA-transferase family III [Cercophora newfieldiana]|uniref:CoA-transferase family III n=1 Tax=Cercophora newfieldiana TaxID=92897 RepID=A0AA39Y508_9PEZI|nr:CoA-transferase family III [Cercophora newfieldiana]